LSGGIEHHALLDDLGDELVADPQPLLNLLRS
jgi:hypothetical protein